MPCHRFATPLAVPAKSQFDDGVYRANRVASRGTCHLPPTFSIEWLVGGYALHCSHSLSRMPRAILLMAGLLAVACSGDTPVTPTPAATTTENFIGSIGTGETKIHAFAVAASGTAEITLGSLTIAGQLATTPVTVAIGTPSEGTCSAITSLGVRPALTHQLAYSVTAGNYCVSIADTTSVLSGSAVYGVRVVHP